MVSPLHNRIWKIHLLFFRMTCSGSQIITSREQLSVPERFRLTHTSPVVFAENVKLLSKQASSPDK